MSDLCYGPLFDVTHRTLKVGVSDKASPWSGLFQSGVWDYLLCNDCEALLNPPETYFGRIWNRHPVIPDQIVGEVVSVKNLEYGHFKVFHLANLWRAHVSQRPEFASVDLGGHAAAIREMLLTSNPGTDQQYPVSGVLLVNDDGSKANKELSPFIQSRRGKDRFWTVIYAGCQWLFWLRPPSTELGFPTLKADGSMTFLVQKWRENPLVRSWVRRLAKDGYFTMKRRNKAS